MVILLEEDPLNGRPTPEEIAPGVQGAGVIVNDAILANVNCRWSFVILFGVLSVCFVYLLTGPLRTW